MHSHCFVSLMIVLTVWRMKWLQPSCNRSTRLTVYSSVKQLVFVFLVGCAASPHGRLSELSRVEGRIALCDHGVPESTCTRHHPELIPKFKRAGDWCTQHGVPESQCLECHPDLTFEPLPQLPPTADVAVIAQAGEDIGVLDAHAVRGKVTVFDFYADWCSVCRKVEGHLYDRLAKGERIALRKLNIVDWDSALAQKWVADVPSLPFVVIYDTSGKRTTSIHGADLSGLDRAIEEASHR